MNQKPQLIVGKATFRDPKSGKSLNEAMKIAGYKGREVITEPAAIKALLADVAATMKRCAFAGQEWALRVAAKTATPIYRYITSERNGKIVVKDAAIVAARMAADSPFGPPPRGSANGIYGEAPFASPNNTPRPKPRRNDDAPYDLTNVDKVNNSFVKDLSKKLVEKSCAAPECSERFMTAAAERTMCARHAGKYASDTARGFIGTTSAVVVKKGR